MNARDLLKKIGTISVAAAALAGSANVAGAQTPTASQPAPQQVSNDKSRRQKLFLVPAQAGQAAMIQGHSSHSSHSSHASHASHASHQSGAGDGTAPPPPVPVYTPPSAPAYTPPPETTVEVTPPPPPAPTVVAPAILTGKRIMASTLLNAKKVAKYSARELTLLRNEPFARYGMVFSRPELNAIYAACPWYSATDVTDKEIFKLLTPIERANITFIKQYQTKNHKTW